MRKEEHKSSVLLTKKEVESIAWDRTMKPMPRAIWFVLSGAVTLGMMFTISAMLNGNMGALCLIPVLLFLALWWRKLSPIYKELKKEMTTEWEGRTPTVNTSNVDTHVLP